MGKGKIGRSSRLRGTKHTLGRGAKGTCGGKNCEKPAMAWVGREGGQDMEGHWNGIDGSVGQTKGWRGLGGAGEAPMAD